MKHSMGRFVAACRSVVSLALAVAMVLLVPNSASAVTFPGGAITIPALGNATPFPSTINVSGLSGGITLITVSLNNFSHVFSGDVDMLLVAPDGKAFHFWSDLGNTTITNFDFTVADSGATNPPQTGALVNGSTYKPTNNAADETFPGATYTNRYSPTGDTANGVATFASVFNGSGPNGIWSLYVIDDGGGDAGSIGSWALNITANGPTATNGSISGKIANSQGVFVSGAVVNLSGTQSRRTITDASGNYRFDEVEPNGFYTVTPARANYSFSPGNRSFSLVGNQTDANFAGLFGGDTENPSDTTEYFVRQQYVDFLGREPDEGGFNYWSDQILQCNGDFNCIRNRRIDVSAAFFASAEFQQTGSYIYGLYAGTLGRTLNHGEFSADRSQVLGGAGLEQAKTAFAEAFVQRAEFTSRYPQSMTREQFVDAVIQAMQVRSGMFMTQYRDGFLSDYDTGGRALVVRHASEASDFVAAEYNKAFVLMEYFGYLRRPEDGGGYAFWLDVLNNGAAGNYRGMVCSFLTSTEYQIRFSTVVTHSNADCGP